MAVLELKPTKAPDLRGTSQILAQAGLSMERAFGSAKGLLGSYQEGVEERADAEVFAEISKLQSRDQIDAYFQSGVLDDKPISSAMRERVGNLYTDVANLAQTRTSTASNIASRERADALEADRAAKEKFRVGKQTQGIKFGAAYAAAVAEAERLGVDPMVPGDRIGAAVSQSAPGAGTSPEFRKVIPGIFAGESKGDYDALFGFSNRPGGKFENVKVTQMSVNELLEFQKVGGEYSNYVKANTKEGVAASPAGGFQVVGDTLRDAAKGLGLTGNEKMTPELQDKIGEWIFNSQGIGAWKGFVPGVEAAPAVAAGADPLAGLRGLGTGTAGLGVDLSEMSILGPRDPAVALAKAAAAGIPQYQAPDVAAPTPDQDRYRKMLEGNQFLSGPELAAREQDIAAARARGTAGFDKIAAAALAEERALAAETAILDPTITTGGEVGGALGDIGDTAVKRLQSREAGQRFAETFASILSPDVEMPEGVAPAVQSEMELIDTGFQTLPQTWMVEQEKKWRGDPTAGLMDLLNLRNDPQNPRTYVLGLWGEDGKDTNILSSLVAEIAKAAGVTKSVAAAGMAKNFIRDPSGINTAEKRFQKEETIAMLKATMGPSAMRRWEGQKLSVLARKGDYKRSVKKLNKLLVTRKKQAANGTNTDSIDQEIFELADILRRGETPGTLRGSARR